MMELFVNIAKCRKCWTCCPCHGKFSVRGLGLCRILDHLPRPKKVVFDNAAVVVRMPSAPLLILQLHRASPTAYSCVAGSIIRALREQLREKGRSSKRKQQLRPGNMDVSILAVQMQRNRCGGNMNVSSSGRKEMDAVVTSMFASWPSGCKDMDAVYVRFLVIQMQRNGCSRNMHVRLESWFSGCRKWM